MAKAPVKIATGQEVQAQPEPPRAQLMASSSSMALLSVIDKLALNPEIDIDKIERFFALYERQQAFEAKREYNKDFAKMIPNFPKIRERGAIKNRSGEAQSTYALWEDVVGQITPTLGQFGFSLTFRPSVTADNRIQVIGILAHRGGHQEEATFVLPADMSGSKNAVQALGSSTSYAKRYLAFAMLNIASEGEDDDGQRGGGNGISQEQADEIRSLIDLTSSDTNKFLNAFKVQRIEDLQANQLDRAIGLLKAKMAKAKKEESADE